MDFTTKIDNILRIKGIKLWELEKIVGMNSTIKKAYEDNRELTGSTESKFLERARINPVWWKTGEGEIFLSEIQDKESITIPLELWTQMQNEKQTESVEYMKVHRRAWDQLEETMAQQRTLLTEMKDNYKALSDAFEKYLKDKEGRKSTKNGNGNGKK
jgi:phage repressor protein C with HTH and peptisase S24 domain